MDTSIASQRTDCGTANGLTYVSTAPTPLGSALLFMKGLSFRELTLVSLVLALVHVRRPLSIKVLDVSRDCCWRRDGCFFDAVDG